MVARFQSWWRRHPRITWGLVLALVAGGVIASVVTAPGATVNLYPNAAAPTTNTGWTCANWDTYLDAQDGANAAVSTGGSQVFLIPMDDPAVSGGTINSITVYGYAMSAAAAARDGIQFAVNGVGNLYGGTASVARNAYTRYDSGVITTNPSTGSGWTWTDIASLQVGVSHTLNGTVDNVNVDQLYVVVDYSPPTLAVTQGVDAGRPSAKAVVGRSANTAVDEINLAAAGGNPTVTQVVVRGLDTASSLQTDVVGVRLFRDDGATPGRWDGTDTQVGTTQAFAADASGSSVTFSGLTLAVASGSTEKLWVVYTVGDAAVDGHIVGSQVSVGDITATGGSVTQGGDIVSSNSGQTIQVDALAPAADTTDPTDAVVIAGTSKTISGSAVDAGAGVASVDVSIRRSDGKYWNGTGWSAAQTWNAATGTMGWTYSWNLDASQNGGPYFYTITARATDNVGLIGTDVTPVSGVKVDNVAPAIASAIAKSSTQVNVVFTEAVQSGSIAPSDFSIDGLTVSNAVLQSDNVTVRLTTSLQAGGNNYTASCGAGNVADTAGNTNDFSSASFNGSGAGADNEPPSAPASVAATAGAASPVLATISWPPATDNVAVTGYRVWRSKTLAGTYSAIATVAASPYQDVSKYYMAGYFYKISALDAAGNESVQSGASEKAAPLWKNAPHVTFTPLTNNCKICHSLHSPSYKLLTPVDGAAPDGVNVCYVCHDGTAASKNIKSGPSNSFALASGHSVEASQTGADLTNSCADCHEPHRDGSTYDGLPRRTINSAAVSTSNNSWCEACHNDSNAWYEGTYPSVATPSRNASGYPVAGTYPGKTVYEDAEKNAHSLIPSSTVAPRPGGSCLYCHSSHRGANEFDGLTLTYRPGTAATLFDDQANGTYAASCFYCHGGVVPSEVTTIPVNIKQFVIGNGSSEGHRIKTAGGKLPVGAQLPCYDCHNPHGSTRGNERLISDELGRNLSTTGAADRGFCLSCHSTLDGKVWDSVSATYTAVSTTGTVEGLKRDGTDGSILKLPTRSGHASTDGQPCEGCHGNDYSSASANNVHNPGAGASSGGTDCYGCHGTYGTNMEDGPGAKTGSARASSYHHVMGSATYDGDKAFAAGSYPTSTTDVYCLSCHVDHDKFNSAKASNLRSNITTVNPVGVAADYNSSTDSGVCTSCHSTSITKQVGIDQKSDGSTATPVIAAGSGAAQYGASAHDYYATSSYAASNFSANCVKCHNDEQTKSFQTSTNRFGTHWSAERSLLSALGGTLTDPLGETNCYGCHTGGTAGNDKYGVAPMTQAARSTQAQFALASKHPVVATGGNSVECESCHNAHVVNTTTGKVTDPANTYNLISYDTTATRNTFCLKCHSGSGSLPVYTVGTTAYVPATVTIAPADASKMTKSTYGARGHWSASGAIGVGEEIDCATCHDNHGSNVTKLLGFYDPATATNKINGTTVTANDNTVCAACHSAATGVTYTRLANGYPNVGTWPGMAVYSGANGIHKGSNVVWPGSTYAGGDCKNCHDVHGTANTYDELVGTFTRADFTLCFNCHDGAPSNYNIKQYYPTTNGGTATQLASTNFGHKIQTPTGNLAAGDGLPCYDCHGVHGSAETTALAVQTVNNNVTYAMGDVASEIDMTTVGGRRQFCFLCHTTGDVTAQGTDYTDGIGYVNITTGGTSMFEGIDRTVHDSVNKRGLKLPPVSGHYAADTTMDCYTCHGSDYSGPASINVHNPGAGLSTGGQDCYGCHAVYGTNMEDGTGAQIGTNRASSYHHVLGSATYDGDKAFATGSYPTSTTDVYCLSCHTDHNNFNASKGSNLRQDLSSSAGSPAANTDYVASGSYGICVNCHTVSQVKQGMGSDQAAGGEAKTPVIGGSAFAGSAHNYTVASSFGGSAFNANCSKCHSDEQGKGFQTSTYAFGTHWSSSQGILKALGVMANPAKEEACFRCHNSVAPAYGETLSAAAKSTQSEFAQTSSHDLSKVACENCHNVHSASAATPVANPDNTYQTASVSTTSSVNSYCLACHDGSAPVASVSDASLVPYTVTVTAKDNISTNYSTDGHGQFVDCRDCHEQHGSSLRQLLRATVDGQSVASYSDTADQTYCLSCHRSGGLAGTSDIARYYPTTAGGTATQADSPVWTRFGHRIKTAGGTATLGSTVPCRQCHDPHGGSGSGYMLVVRTQVAAGVDTLIGDAPGEIVMSDASQTPANASNTRNFCFTCHTTSDTSFGWNGYSMALVPAGAKVLGLSRTGGALKLPDLGTIKGHKQAETDSCYLCHGDDFSQSDSVNVHNPGAGESRGGLACYDCHTVYENRMEDGLGSATGGARTSSYHHVLGSAGKDGDSVSSPTLSADGRQNVYCLSCHVDHDKFSPLVVGTQKRSANLRSAFSDAAVTATSTDFLASTGGVCLGCHSVAVAKDNAGQKAEAASSKTPTITSTVYDASPHQYSVTSTFTDSSIFNADCSKCHDSEIDGGGMESGKATSGFQTSTYRFSTHYSAARRILGSLGVPLVDPPSDELTCLACHSKASDGLKSFANMDWYGTASMSANSQAIYGLMSVTPTKTTETTNTLYLWPTGAGNPSEPMPNAHQTGDAMAGGTWIGRLMAPVRTSTAYETKAQATNLTGTRYWNMVTFSSPAAASAASIPGGTWTIKLNARSTNTLEVAKIRYMIYKWNAADTLGTTIVAKGTYATTLGTTAAPGTQYTIPLAGGAVNLAVGDKIAVCLELETAQTATGPYTGTFYFGSGAESSLTLPGSVAFNWTTPAVVPFGHLVGNYTGKHLPSPDDETQAYLSANKHVECGDCHNVHAAGKTSHTRGGATGNAIGADSPIQDVSGVSLTAGTTNWSTTGATLSSTSDSTYEYQICFKCHSRANTGLASWSPAAPNDWTDAALEFSPANRSGHPVVATLNNSSGRTAPKALTAAQMSAPWTNVGNQTMMCSDCHGDSAATPAAQGPHGSAVAHMLKGPNSYWPANASGTLYVLGNPPTLTGLFCTNCHPVYSGGYKNAAHSDKASRYGNLACIRCHILVPHGGKVSRLIGTNTAGMPTRYAYQGLRTNFYVNAFGKAAPNSYTKEYCYTTNGSCNGAHPSSPFTTESW